MAARRRPRAGKFGAIKTVVDGITFDSRGESECYKDLKHLESAGKIRDLKLQVPFVLAPAAIVNGRKKIALRYIADFTYYDIEKGVNVVHDFKGRATDVYIIKRHLMKTVHNIDIYETYAR